MEPETMGVRILLVDDNPDDRVMVERRLRQEFPGIQIEQVSGAAGLDRALEQGGFDLVITDYRLRWTDGIAVSRAVKARIPDCPVIMFTATGSEEIAVEAMKKGLDDYVIKSSKHLVRLVASVRAALERARERAALREVEARYVRLFEHVPLGVYRTTPDGRILDVNPAYVQILRCPNLEHALAVNVASFYDDPQDRERFKTLLEREGIVRGFEVRARRSDGTAFWAENNARAILGADGRVQFYEGTIQDITERKQAEEALRESERFLAHLHEITRAMLDAPGFEETLQAVADRLGEVLGADGCYIALWDEAEKRSVPIAAYGPSREIYPLLRIEPGEATLTESALKAGRVLAVEDALDSPHVSARIARTLGTRSALVLPLISGDQKLGAVTVAFGRPHSFTPDEIARAEQAAHLLSLAAARARLLDFTRRHAEELADQARLFERLLSTRDLDQRLRHMLDGVMDLVGAEIGGIYLMDGGKPVVHIWKGASEELVASTSALPVGTFVKWFQRTHIVRERLDEQGRMLEFAKGEGIQAWASIPLYLPALQEGEGGEEWRGAILVASRDLNALPEDKVRAVERISPQLALFIDHSTAYRKAQDRMARLQALHDIDLAISSSLDLRVTLAVLLSAATSYLRVDAAAVLLLGRHTHTFEHAADHGFLTDAYRRVRVRLGEGPAGRAVLERRIIVVPRLSEEEGLVGSPLLVAERFVTAVAAPLTAKGQVKGVLELFHRAPLDPDPEWLLLLEGLAAQAAIAVDSAVLFEDLQRSSAELALAYDAILEVSVRSLDLRDKETEGHTQRVTEMTVRLAAALGVPEADLVNVRRGALLHDVGKIGVPDAILHKPGPLTEEEWVVMRRHPVQAREMLLPIPSLRPALDIPYSHHEKWDGTGYPQGLRGEQIPLAARIFAVVDVWDALRSDRPYRKAWDDRKAIDYIREQAGKHFDPRVVEAFLRMIETSV